MACKNVYVILTSSPIVAFANLGGIATLAFIIADFWSDMNLFQATVASFIYLVSKIAKYH